MVCGRVAGRCSNSVPTFNHDHDATLVTTILSSLSPLLFYTMGHKTTYRKPVIPSQENINKMAVEQSGKTVHSLSSYPHSKARDTISHWEAKHPREMAEPAAMHQLKRRSPWFWITTCAVAVFFVLISPRAPTLWRTSFSLDRFSTIITPRESLSSADEIRPVDPGFKAITQFPDFDITEQVQFDNFSLILRGQRVFLQ